MRKSKRLQGLEPNESHTSDQEEGTAAPVGQQETSGHEGEGSKGQESEISGSSPGGNEQVNEEGQSVEGGSNQDMNMATDNVLTPELVKQLVEALRPGIASMVHEAVAQLGNELKKKQNKNKKSYEKQNKNDIDENTRSGEYEEGEESNGAGEQDEVEENEEETRSEQNEPRGAESREERGKARLKETQMSGKPILKSLQADEIYKFQLLYRRWEKQVVQDGLGLSRGMIINYLSEEVLLELHMAKVDTTSSEVVMEYLEQVRSQGIESKKASILTDISRKVKWTNKGNISLSMSQYLQQVDRLLMGIELDEDPYLDKLLCLEVLKRLPKAFKGTNPKHTIKRRRWRSYQVMRSDLLDLARVLAPQDFDDPALKMTPNPPSQVKKEPRAELTRYRAPGAPGGLGNRRMEDRIRLEQTPDGARHRLPDSWTKERKKEYAKQKSLCLFCFTEGHRIGGCKLLKKRNGPINNVNRMETQEKEELQEKVANVTIEGESSGEDSSGISLFSDEECYMVRVIEEPAEDILEVEEVDRNSANGNGDSDKRAVIAVGDGNKADVAGGSVVEECNGYDGEVVDPDNDRTLDFENYVRYREQGFGENTAMDRDTGTNEEQVIKQIIEERFKQLAAREIVDGENLDKLQRVYRDNWDAFAVNQSECQLSDLTQMEVELKPGARPFAAKAHPVVGKKKDFLEGKLLDLEKIGAISRDPNPYFSSPAFVVPKATPGKFRMVIDLTRLNDNTIRNSFGLPHWETQMAWIGAKNKFFACVNAISGFDMLKVSEKASKYFGISTIFGSYRLKCSPMGYHSTPGVRGKDLVRQNRRGGVVQWLDDSLVYAETVEELADTINQFMINAKKRNLRLNINKCVLLTLKPTWCGRIFSSAGWRFADKYAKKIEDIPNPTQLGHLESIVYISNWLSSSLPQYAAAKRYLEQRMNKAINTLVPYKYRRNKKKRKKVSLEGFWKEKDRIKFDEFKKYISQAMERNLALYSQKRKLSIYTDASHLFWSACIVASPQSDDVFTFEPMFFISGTFTGPGLNWSVTSKELFPILKALLRYQYIFYSHPTPIHIFTDHRNILGLMDPGKLIKAAELGRLERWKMMIQGFTLVFHHLEGEKNILADCLTRWGVPDAMRKKTNILMKDKVELRWNGCIFRISKEKLKRILREQESKDEVNKLVDEDLNRGRRKTRLESSPPYRKFVDSRISYLHPIYRRKKGEYNLMNEKRLADFCELVKKRLAKIQDVELSPGGLYLVNKKIVIPKEMQERLMVQVHIASGHASKEEVARICEGFHWEELSVGGMKEMVNELARVCLHCERPTKLIRRAYGGTIHAEHPNQIIHADFMKLRGVDILVLTDDLSRKCLIQRCKTASAEEVVRCLIKWRSANGLIDNFILSTNKGSHFANSVVQEFLKYYGGSHNFSIVYSPWSNSGSERQNRALLKVLRTLASQYMVQGEDWVKLLDLTESFLNNRPRSKIRMTPNEIMMGRSEELSYMNKDWKEVIKKREKHLLDPIFSSEEQRLIIPSEKTLETMDQFTAILLQKDKDVFSKLEGLRKKARDKLNKRLPLERVQYQPGDWVLVALKGLPLSRDKLRLSWVGPYQVVSTTGHNLYKVKNLKGREREVHSQRITFYEDKMFKMDETIKAVWVYNEGEFEIKELLTLLDSEGRLNFTVAWKGFETFEPTVEPFQQIANDQPEMVGEFLETKRLPKRIRKKAEEELEQIKRGKVREVAEVKVEYEADAWLVVEYPESCAALDQGILRGLSTNKGWTPKEKLVLAQLVRVYGIGNWRGMLRKPWLPGKSKSQLISMTQKLCGTQAIGEYRGLKISLQLIHDHTSLKPGVRKKGMLVNTSRRLPYHERERRILENFDELRDKQKPLTEESIHILSPGECSSRTWSLFDLKRYVNLVSEMSLRKDREGDMEHQQQGTTFWIKAREEWRKVDAIMDSGATRTCGSYQYFVGNKLVDPLEISSSRVRMETATKSMVAVKGEVYCDLKINVRGKGRSVTVEASATRIILAEGAFSNLLIGKDVLKKIGATPEEALMGKGEVREESLREDLGKEENLLVKYEEWKRIYEEQKSRRHKRATVRAEMRKLLVPEFMDKCRSLVEHGEVESSGWKVRKVQQDHVYELRNEEKGVMKVWMQPSQSLLLEADIMEKRIELKGFDIVYADPPWDVGVANNPTRGMTLHFSTLKDEQIKRIPLGKIVNKGLAAIWVPNNKLDVGMKWLIEEGFSIKEYLVWIKKTSLGKTFQSQGNLLMHSKELLIIGIKGLNVKLRTQVGNDIVEGAVREPFRKPDAVYTLLEKMYPEARKLELFARHWNVRENWVSVGNEVKGTAALKEGSVVQEPDRDTSSFNRKGKLRNRSWAFAVRGGRGTSSGGKDVLQGESGKWKIRYGGFQYDTLGVGTETGKGGTE
eukprot:snap_masked-scaffold_83-processed-gene-0.35-mRNA-1 protein AED:0.49 eAED:0.49 QI:0/0/0/0.5/1/1/2/0/2407